MEVLSSDSYASHIKLFYCICSHQLVNAKHKFFSYGYLNKTFFFFFAYALYLVLAIWKL